MDEVDRDGYSKEVASLADRLAGADAENAVWDVYAETEKLIAILKFRMDYETPGVFAKLPDASDPAKLLKDARKLLSKAAEEISKGRLVESIGTLRKARNELRGYLIEKRKSVIKSRGTPRSELSA